MSADTSKMIRVVLLKEGPQFAISTEASTKILSSFSDSLRCSREDFATPTFGYRSNPKLLSVIDEIGIQAVAERGRTLYIAEMPEEALDTAHIIQTSDPHQREVLHWDIGKIICDELMSFNPSLSTEHDYQETIRWLKSLAAHYPNQPHGRY